MKRFDIGPAAPALPAIPSDPGLGAGVPATSEPTAKPKSTDQRPWYKRPWRVAAVVVAALALVGGPWAYAALHHTPGPKAAAVAPVVTPSPTPTATPATLASPLTGLQVDPSLAARPISGVMIEKLYPDARPQARLQSAGGSSDALALVGPLHALDLNALVIGAPTYYRSSSRVAPHNLYTSSSLLDAVNKRFGFTKTPSFAVSPRQADAPAATPPHPLINIAFSSAAYAVRYVYDAKSNAYTRYDGGTPHIDSNTGTAISVKNIVVEYMPVTYTPAPHNSQYVNMPTVGSGKTIVFRDGNAVIGTWSKASHTARTQLVDAAGKDIPLDAGNTWYEIVPSGNAVNY
jgi:hypothetical protein